MEERREYVRLDAGVNVNYKTSTAPNRGIVSTSKDISAGGIRFFTDQKLRIGSVIDLEISLPEQELPVSVNCEVVFSDEFSIMTESSKPTFETAVKFISIEDKNKDKISKYIFGKINRHFKK